MGANPGRLPGGGGSLNWILKMNATLLLGGEEAVERLVACPCKSEIPSDWLGAGHRERQAQRHSVVLHHVYLSACLWRLGTLGAVA